MDYRFYFVGKHYVLGFLCIWFFLFGFSAVVADSKQNPEDLFFIFHDYDCTDNRSVLTALKEADAFPEEAEPEIATYFNELTFKHRNGRSNTTVDNGLSVGESVPAKRRLAELSPEDRRDQIIAALDLFVTYQTESDLHVNGGNKFSERHSARSASTSYLPRFGIDVIDDSTLPNSKVFNFAKSLPCMAYPPERNARRYFKTQPGLPNDFNADHQYYLASGEKGGINAVKAWKCYNGQHDGPVVAILDTGASMHPDLEGNLCKCNDACAGSDISATISPYREPRALQHATSVASLVAAVTNNNDGIAGVCWGCRIMSVRVADDDGNLYVNNILKGIDYVIEKRVKITNHSYGAYGGSQAEFRAFKALERAGILAVIAAGNESCDIDEPFSSGINSCRDPCTGKPLPLETPGGYSLSNMIVVGASDKDSRMSGFSNFGKAKVHFFAPGETVLALKNTKYNFNPKEFVDGTSFSAPLTAGAAALLLGHDPSLTIAELRQLLFSTVRKVPALKDKCVTGGILDIGAAMEALSKRKACPTLSKSSLISKVEKDHTEDFYSNDGCPVSQHHGQQTPDFVRIPFLSNTTELGEGLIKLLNISALLKSTEVPSETVTTSCTKCGNKTHTTAVGEKKVGFQAYLHRALPLIKINKKNS